MTERYSREQWNLIRDRLGLCPIEEIRPGESQLKNKRSIVIDQTFEEALESFRNKYGGREGEK